MEVKTVDDLTTENISQMTGLELVSSVPISFEIAEKRERLKVQQLIKARAAELNVQNTINECIAECKKDYEEFQQDSIMKELECNKNGTPKITVNNFLTIMNLSPFYSGVRYNSLANRVEIVSQDGAIQFWTDTNTSASANYIEKHYGIYSTTKHEEALKLFFEKNKYNPITDIIDNLTWDGTERCEHFLTEWLKTDDSPYTREVSRLIFAGGINRIYLPGCKFEDVPILVGTTQGEGKTTIVHWLAIHDCYYGEATTIEGNASIEQLDGVWICEISELLALTRVKEQAAVKSYISRQRDKFRRPYSRFPQEYPRQCIFIGTTNEENFLTDKTGNRRFYPVKVKSSGYWLYDHEQECRDYILQCWAEAKAKYDKGEMPCYARLDLLEAYKQAQEEAMEDDWRVGAIGAYLDSLQLGEVVCVRQLAHEALSANRDFPKDPTPKDSREIGQIMRKFTDWQNAGNVRTRDYGVQKCWRRVRGNSADELPF